MIYSGTGIVINRQYLFHAHASHINFIPEGDDVSDLNRCIIPIRVSNPLSLIRFISDFILVKTKRL